MKCPYRILCLTLRDWSIFDIFYCIGLMIFCETKRNETKQILRVFIEFFFFFFWLELIISSDIYSISKLCHLIEVIIHDDWKDNDVFSSVLFISFSLGCYTGCPRMFYTVFQKTIKNIKSTMSLIIILVIECLICALPTVKISFTYLFLLRCDMVSLKIDE